MRIRATIGRDARRTIAAGLALAAGTGWTGAAQAKDLPPPQTDIVPPVELVVSAEGTGIACAPGELRLPARTNVHLRLVNQTKTAITITAPKIFEGPNLLRHDGDLVHVASEAGYTLKAEGRGDIELRTLEPGQYPFGCTGTQDRSRPFKGTLVFIPPT